MSKIKDDLNDLINKEDIKYIEVKYEKIRNIENRNDKRSQINKKIEPLIFREGLKPHVFNFILNESFEYIIKQIMIYIWIIYIYSNIIININIITYINNNIEGNKLINDYKYENNNNKLKNKINTYKSKSYILIIILFILINLTKKIKIIYSKYRILETKNRYAKIILNYLDYSVNNQTYKISKYLSKVKSYIYRIKNNNKYSYYIKSLIKNKIVNNKNMFFITKNENYLEKFDFDNNEGLKRIMIIKTTKRDFSFKTELKKNNKLRKFRNKNKLWKIIFRLLIIIISFSFINNNIRFMSKFSNVTLKIQSSGNRNIFSSKLKTTYYPDYIIINGKRVNDIHYWYNFEGTNNIIKIVWNDIIDDCKDMFYDCEDISELDLSHFDSSKVFDMQYMFSGCRSLTSLNLANFNTLNVVNMGSMFENCLSLTSLDLSKFNTSKAIDMRSMFGGCESLISLNLSSFNTSNVVNMGSMFYYSRSLTFLYLFSFNTKNVINMGSMFYYCRSLSSLNLSNFNTKNVVNMESMFSNCESLISLNLSSFITSNVFNMRSMFEFCSSLTSLNLSNFNTSNVVDMESMFSNCGSLTSLDLSNFKTSNVVDMRYMFEFGWSLISIDLSSFDNSNVVYMKSMFSNCENLEFVNLKNFNEIKLKFYDDIFENITDNAILCINKERTKIIPDQTIIKCLSIDCEKDWKINQKKIINNECTSSCNDEEIYKYEYNGKCYKNCTNGVLSNNICKCELEKCLSCPPLALKKNLCTTCNNNYFPKVNDSLNLGDYINCYKEIKGFYLDRNNSLFKQCYNTCETCEIKGDDINHNCLKCKSDFSVNINYYSYNNCYKPCDYYYYLDNEFNYHCTKNLSCPIEYPVILNKNECSKENISSSIIKAIENILNNAGEFINYKDIKNIFIYIFNNETIENYEENEIKYYDSLIDSILESKNYNTSNLDNGMDEILESEKFIYTISTIENQKHSKNKNMTTIDFGECELLIRKSYNLSNNETIYVKKIDIVQEGMKIPKVEYEIYSKLSANNITKLNLSICENSNINILVPTKITGNIDEVNISSGYYSDICYTAKSDWGTDITLKDRKKEFIERNKTVCQEDCFFSEYDYMVEKAKCVCKVKEFSLSLNDVNINKTKLLNNFVDIKNYLNLNVLVCYEQLISKAGILLNIGFYIISCIIIFHVISIFLFCLKHWILTKNKIYDIKNAIVNLNQKEENSSNCRILNTGKKITKNNSKNNSKKSKKKKFFWFNKKKNKNKSKSKSKNKNKNKKNNTNIITIGTNINNIKKNVLNNKTKNNKTLNNFSKTKRIDKQFKEKKKKFEKKEDKLKYTNDEINTLSYKLALKFDKRKYCEYYISLLKTKHILIFSFCYSNDYNSRIVKMDLFFLGFTIYYTVNALFYNDDTMHKIYESRGLYDLETQITKIIYSSLISIILNTLLKFLALSNDSIIEFKKNKEKNNIQKRLIKLIKILKIKFFFYFIFSTIFLLFFCYYISLFGAIYKNTQYYLIKDTLISFGLSLFYPFVIHLLPGIFRIPALSSPKKHRECLYKISKILQIF